jgi:cytoskeletal protein RodZ
MAREAHRKVEPALTLHTRGPQNAVRGPEIASYESVADLLRRTREQYGEDLRSVAEALRIRYVHLLAIEEGRFRDLPGSTYALGFVRSYAEFLGLDGPELVERFKEEVAELNRKTQLVFPTPVPEGKVPGGALILISVILLGAAYGAWSYLSRPGATIADLIPPVPEHLQSLSGEDAGPAVGSGPAAVGTDPVRETAPADGTRATTLPANLASDEPTATEVAAARAPEAPTADAPGGAAGPGTVAKAIPAAEALAASGAGDEGAEATSAAPSPGQAAGDELVPPADETPGQGAGQSAGENAGENGAAAADAASQADAGAPTGAAIEDANGSNLRPVVDAMPLPEAAEPEAAGATLGAGDPEAADPEAADRALAAAPADHLDSLDSATEESIPAAPQLASRVPGREPQVYGADNVEARIVLRARQDSWVQVRDAQDSLLLTRVLRQGDEYRVPNRSGLTLLTGNAGGIDILVDGRRLPPLGPLGAVRRDIVLDPEQLARRGAASQ